MHTQNISVSSVVIGSAGGGHNDSNYQMRLSGFVKIDIPRSRAVPGGQAQRICARTMCACVAWIAVFMVQSIDVVTLAAPQ